MRTPPQSVSSGLPTGPVTFVLTDIEGSTRLLIDLGADYTRVIDRHNALLREVILAHEGVVVSTVGDSVFAVFADAGDAVAAVTKVQRRLSDVAWPRGRQVRVRVGVHAGVGVLGGDDYVGLDVHRAARISSSGRGGQVLLSDDARRAAGDRLPPGVTLRDLGEHALKDLVQVEHIYQLVIPGLPNDFPEPAHRRRRVSILPVPRTSFIERPEVEAVGAAVRHTRLVTLTGPGGSGKTRLAVQVAMTAGQAFADGVAFVDLAAVRDDAGLSSAVAETLGVPAGTAATRERIVAWVADHPAMMLILDNFEQVVDLAPQVSDVLDRCPELTVLVTSRTPLRIHGETEFRVDPLPAPRPGEGAKADSPAVRLFVERARTIDDAFRLTDENWQAVADIVSLVDGLPLAIELAAARTSILSVSDIASRLRAGGQLALLGRADRDAPGRHRSLRSVIAWSYELLQPAEQQVFERLSVFAGGASLDTVEAVLGNDAGAVDSLQTLVETNLLTRRPVGDSARFSMLVTIKEFAAELLAESPVARDTQERHAETFLSLAEQAASQLTGWDQRRWLDRLEQEHDNLRGSLDWAVSAEEADTALRLSAAMWRFWQIRGHLDEGKHRVTDALGISGASPTARAAALDACGGIDWWRGEILQAREAYQQALDLMETHGTLAQRANARVNLCLTYAYTEHHGAGIVEGLQEARDEASAAGDTSTQAWATWGLSDAHFTLGHSDESYQAALAALDLFTGLDDPFGIGWSQFMAANALLGTTRTAEARDRLLTSMRLFARFADLSALVLHLWALAQVEADEGHLERALTMGGMSEGLRARSGAGIMDINAESAEAVGKPAVVAMARQRMSESQVEELMSRGRAYSPYEALAYALGEDT